MHRLPNGVQLEGGTVPGAPGFRYGPPGYGYLQPGGGYGGPNSSFGSQSASPVPGMGQGQMHDDEFPALDHKKYPIAAASTITHGRSEQKPLRATSGRKPASNTTTDVHAQPQWSAITSDHSPPRPHNSRSHRSLAYRQTENMNSKAYQAYCERPTQLSAARNACLAPAADAWRRGDVQLAKRFTREGHELNAKMRSEGCEGGRRAVLEWWRGSGRNSML